VARPNPAAALPSLHAAYPWLVLLFAVRFFGKRGWLFLIYNAAVWFSIVYLAQHWVVDIFAGIAWATASFLLVDAFWSRMLAGNRVIPVVQQQPAPRGR
jgi:membrane-associated phospholipid phosphatase